MWDVCEQVESYRLTSPLVLRVSSKRQQSLYLQRSPRRCWRGHAATFSAPLLASSPTPFPSSSRQTHLTHTLHEQKKAAAPPSGSAPAPDFKALVTAGYAVLVQSGMDKTAAAAEAIRRVKERQQ